MLKTMDDTFIDVSNYSKFLLDSIANTLSLPQLFSLCLVINLYYKKIVTVLPQLFESSCIHLYNMRPMVKK